MRCWRRCWRTSSPRRTEIYRDLRKDLAAGAVIEVLLGARGQRRRRAPAVEGAAARHAVRRTETAERKGDRCRRAAARADLQDGACRPYRQAVLCPHLARRDQGRRDTGWHAARRHLSISPAASWRRCAEAVGGRHGRVRPAGWRGDRRHRVARRDAGAVAVPRLPRRRSIRWRSLRRITRTT